MPLSPGKLHLQVPQDRRENLEFRRWLLRKGRENPRVRLGYLEVCKHDILFWVNSFVWQYNPNSIGVGSMELGPFITWDFQDEAFHTMLECVEKRRDLVIEKSREMGASWMCLLLIDWIFLFHGWKKFLVISRNEFAVDKPGDPDSLFWKLDFVHDHLPNWMVKPRVRRRKMGFKNVLNHSTITGQASTGKAGVGGRATAMFIDEFSQIAEDFEVLQRTSDTTGCRIFNFTHLGMDTAAYGLIEAIDNGMSNAVKLQLHWTQHPDKVRGLYKPNGRGGIEVLDKEYQYDIDFNFVMDGLPVGGPFPGLRSPWYDDQCKRKGSPRGIAMDLDINPLGSVSQFFDPVQIRDLQLQWARPPVWEGDLLYDRDTGHPTQLTERPGGPIRMWACTPDGRGLPPFGKYALATDVSTGSGATPSCLSLGDCLTGEKILEYVNAHMDAKAFAVLAAALGWLFKDANGDMALITWEIPGPGQTFGATLVDDLGYPKVWRRVRVDKLTREITENVGWANTVKTKLPLLEEYRAALYSRQFLNHSELALAECLSFKYTSTGVEHGGESSTNDPTKARVNHGDRVIADALLWMLMKGKQPTGKPGQAKEIVRPGSYAWRRELRARRNQEEGAWA